MPDLPVADPEALIHTLSFALRYDRRGKRTHQRDEMTARAAAEHLAEALRLSGYVVCKGPPRPAHGIDHTARPASYEDRTD